MSRLLIKASNPMCQLQDAGRFGVRHLGVTQGGPADWLSMTWANWLLGNPLGAATLEITLGGLTLIALDDCTLALAGADLAATVDGQALKPWRHLELKKGQTLSLTQPLLGARAYLAAPGGFVAPPVLGSSATVVREQLGGPDGFGRAVAVGDELTCAADAPALREIPLAQQPAFKPKPLLDVVLGAQIGAFSGQSTFDTFNHPWTLDSRADRMGIRLQGPVLEYQGAPMISEGIPLGAIQVPPDGQPIVLLNDRQTIGGYPRLGALSPLAQARLAQCLPAETVYLRPITQEAAQRQQRDFMLRFG